jgi:hypothetical protein
VDCIDGSTEFAPTINVSGERGRTDVSAKWESDLSGERGRKELRLYKAAGRHFLPNGNLIYRASEGGRNYVYTRQQDGTGREKWLEKEIMDLQSVSPDGRWIIVFQKDDTDKEHPYRTVAYPNGGGKPEVVCATCNLWWSVDGKYEFLQFAPTLGPDPYSKNYLLPVIGKRGLPELPPDGLSGPEDLKQSTMITVLPRGVDSVLGPEKYSYTITNTRRNIYRIPIS